MPRFLLVGFLIVIAGCSPKLNIEKKVEVDNGGMDFEIQGIAKEQKINVTASASGGKMNVYIFLEKDKAAVDKEINSKKHTKVLASSENTESASLTAAIPAKEVALVRVLATTLKKANVTMKITN